MSADWTTKALCRTADTNTFFPSEDQIGIHARRTWNTAKAWCAPCPVTEECLREALTLERGRTVAYRGGVWGGLTPAERAEMDKAAGRTASAQAGAA